jgi:hypothetical protein
MATERLVLSKISQTGLPIVVKNKNIHLYVACTLKALMCVKVIIILQSHCTILVQMKSSLSRTQ